MAEPRRLGLRARGAVAFAVLALLLSTSLSLLTYQLTRSYLIDQRESLALRQALVNARAVSDALRSTTQDVPAILTSLTASAGHQPVVRVGNQWYATSVAIGREDLPASLLSVTANGHAANQRTHINGTPVLVVGVPLGASDRTYFEVFSFAELERTLSTLAWSLFAAACATTLLGAAVGGYASRRVLRPVGFFSNAATEITRGHLETRLDARGDADLAPLAASFNDMAEALQRRIEQEVRFASDVTHELRTPLTAISAAIDVLDRRSDDRTRPAIEVLHSEVRYFQQLVLDLLEISRMDAGAGDWVTEPVEPLELVASVMRRLGHDDVAIDVMPSTPTTMSLDKRRVERIIANLVENADRYAAGPVRVELAGTDGHGLRIAIEDAGPGIPVAERLTVFARFARGSGSADQSERGSGLGLSLVEEHCRVHGGRVGRGSRRRRRALRRGVERIMSARHAAGSPFRQACSP